jgi:DNA-binding SARP family transcriptional activator/predicted ATPase
VLHVRCLGNLAAVLDDVTLPSLTNAKPLAVWLYVALSQGQASRATLAGLFWGEGSDSGSRGSLRFALNRLRTLLPGHIAADRSRIFIPEGATWCTDIAPLLASSDAEALETGALIELPVEQFLVGLQLRGAPEAEDWVSQTRSALLNRYHHRLAAAAETARSGGLLEQETDLRRRRLALDPFSESDHAALIRSYLEQGLRAAALAQFESCRELLEKELGTVPGPALQAVAECLRRTTPSAAPAAGTAEPLRNAAAPGPAAPVVDNARPLRTDGYPVPASPDLPRVARPHEQQQVCELLRNPAARLVSLLGPGGAGKTHLAMEVARQLEGDFPDGVDFIELADLQPADPAQGTAMLIERLAGRLAPGCLPGTELEAVLGALSGCSRLLVLDNFEQLAGSAGVLSTLTSHAAGLRILVTSRHRLGLPTEWSVTLGGLPFPALDVAAAEGLRYPAVDLFIQRAQRIRPDFSPLAEYSAVARICATVEGFPLAVTLASHWLAGLSTAAIADRLEQGMALLHDAPPGTPGDRHRGMRAVFEQSWVLLDEEEQSAFAAVSVFQGGFTPEAACAVTGCRLGTLSSLCGKSLLRARTDDRLEAHPLLHELALMRLSSSAVRLSEVREAHADHFLARLLEAQARFDQLQDVEAFAALIAERANLLAAFEWWHRQANAAKLESLLAPLWTMYRLQGWFEEIATLLQRSVALAGLPPEVRAAWLLWIGEATFQLERHQLSRDVVSECLTLLGEVPPRSWRALPHALATVAHTLVGSTRRPPLGSTGELLARAHNRMAQLAFFEGDRKGFLMDFLDGLVLDGGRQLAAHQAGGSLVLSYTPLKWLAARLADDAEQKNRSAPLFDRAWGHELLCLYNLGIGGMEAALNHGEAGRELFRELRQHRNWGECAGLVANWHIYMGRLERAHELMSELELRGREVRNPSAESWGLYGVTHLALRRGETVQDFPLERARHLAGRVVDPNTQLLHYGTLAWWHARAARHGEAVIALGNWLAVFRRTQMLSIYALHSVIGATQASLAGWSSDGHEAQQLRALTPAILASGRKLASLAPLARPFVRYLEGQWLIARGERERGERLARRALATLPSGVDLEGFETGMVRVARP